MAKIANYLQIPYVAGTGELAVLCGAVLGGGLAFLWYNSYPADLFMGDVGSLPLGALLGAISVMTKQEIVLIIVGGFFVVEALSVILQVAYFRASGRAAGYSRWRHPPPLRVEGLAGIQVTVRSGSSPLCSPSSPWVR